jgi:hypothetical protein
VAFPGAYTRLLLYQTRECAHPAARRGVLRAPGTCADACHWSELLSAPAWTVVVQPGVGQFQAPMQSHPVDMFGPDRRRLPRYLWMMSKGLCSVVRALIPSEQVLCACPLMDQVSVGPRVCLLVA